MAVEFSLLYPPGYDRSAEIPMKDFQFIHTLQIDEMVVLIKERYRGFSDLMLENFYTTDPAVLKYRLAVVQDLVENENRMVLDTYLEVPSVDYEKLTAQVRYRITLREYSDSCEVSLQIDDREIPMKMGNPGEFVCDFESNLFESNETAKIILRENGKNRVEEVESTGNLFEKFLPMPSCPFFLSSDMQFGKLKAEGYYSVEVEKPEEVESATVTYMTGGSDIKTLDITKQVQTQSEITLEKDLPLEKDLTFRIEILMQNGLRTVKQFMACYEAGSGADGMEFERILDGKGNVLWESKYYVEMQ